MLENGYETLHDGKGHRVLQEDYELTVIKKADNGWALERKIIFSRTDLKPHQQFIYSEDGKVATDAKYAEYKDFSGTIFPSRIQISRPQEEYDITLNMLKVEINTPLKDEQFVLTQPAGARWCIWIVPNPAWSWRPRLDGRSESSHGHSSRAFL